MRATTPDPVAAPSLAEEPSRLSTITPTSDADMVEVPLTLDTPNIDQPIAHTSISPIVRRPSQTRPPRLNTRTSSMASPLPWKIDETGSPATPMRKHSYAPPPRYAPASATPYHQPSWQSSSRERVDMSHPPGYLQDHRASFSDRSSPMYSNDTPFYQNSLASGHASPMTPTRRGRGILDNDPDLYLRGEEVEEDSYWNTAAKLVKAAGKRLSQGEQQIWRVVNAVANGDEDR